MDQSASKILLRQNMGLKFNAKTLTFVVWIVKVFNESTLGSRGGLLVSVLTFYSNDPSLNPSEVHSL